jgi:hypothetical protein
MRLQSPERQHNVETAKTLMKALLLCSAVGLAAGGVSPAAAQGTAPDVAYVETVSGSVVASSQGALTVLDALDVIGDQTRLNLQANSELRICHYRARKIVRLSGPLRALISASAVTAEGGKAIDPTSETCAAPVVSTFQGGFVTRNIALMTTDVPLRPSIKVVDRGTKAIRKIALWDDMQQTILATFDRKMARPLLDHGKSYLLVIEQSDGGELKMLLQAREATRTGPLIVVVR